MRALLCAAACWQLPGVAVGHGAMYEPPSRNSRGIPFLQPGCQGGSCFFYSIGSTIGCPKAGGTDSNPGSDVECQEYRTHQPPPCCDSPAEQTLPKELRSYDVDGNNTGFPCPHYGPGYQPGKGRACGGWTATNPWRRPGSAPVLDPCGTAGGVLPGTTPKNVLNPIDPAPFTTQGFPGSKLPPLLEKTVWIAGGTAEVAWGIFANHGGGYSYRLCPAGSDPTEECFQQLPLDFVGDTQWLQFGDGMDTANRTEIPAAQVSEGTFPAGSQWRRNPVPACAGGPYGTGGGTDPIKSLSPKKLLDSCEVPLFPPAMPGVFGFGLGGTPKRVVSSQVGIVDKVAVPKVPPGDYVLSFRWDCEQTSQVWQSCGDVTIKEAGEPTKPFTPLSGCDACCGDSPCANCTACVNDKTGACAYCWESTVNPFPDIPVPIKFTCLGHEDKDGGPGYSPFEIADTFHPEKLLFLLKGVSPGCPKCWADKDSCSSRER